MMRSVLTAVVIVSLVSPVWAQEKAAEPVKPAAPAGSAAMPALGTHTGGTGWIEHSKAVHAKFKGEKGTFALFGDSITISMAFWASLKWSHQKMDGPTQAAFDLVNGYMKPECWNKWRGSKYGNDGMKTIKWAHDNIETWLKDMNPEAAVIMFGTNDCPGMKLEDYEARYRVVIQKCLDNGTVLILTTMPPKHGADEKAKGFVEVVRKLAAEYKLPLCDYYKAIKDRRPNDWDGADAKFKPAEGEKKGVYEVNAPISRDGGHPSNPKAYQGDYTEEGLKNNGFVLRNYVTLMSYAEVIRAVLKPDAKAETHPKAEAAK